jgi:hypothetical protein
MWRNALDHSTLQAPPGHPDNNGQPGVRLWRMCAMTRRSIPYGCRAVNEIKDDDTIIVNEYDLVPTQADFATPHHLWQSRLAGWAGGWRCPRCQAGRQKAGDCTLGMALYVRNPPLSFVSQAQGLPTLTVIFNSRVWNAVRRANLAYTPTVGRQDQ